MDTIARGLLAAERILADGRLDAFVEDRYAGWGGALGRDILEGRESLAGLRERVAQGRREPTPASGRQEYLENLFARFL
jgi:xylose isomerase